METDPRPVLLRPSIFEGVADVVAAFSTRMGGFSLPPFDSLNLGLNTEDDPRIVRKNYAAFFASLGFSEESAASARQVHGSRVLPVKSAGLAGEGDGMVTNRAGILLSVLTADCAAVLFASAEASVIAACHAGWRGTVRGIIENTVQALADHGAGVASLRVFVGPCICRQEFEVGPEVASRFEPEHVWSNPRSGKLHVDLKAAIRSRLEKKGVSPRHIEMSPQCTFGEPASFYSYRRDGGKTGRMMGVIGITGR